MSGYDPEASTTVVTEGEGAWISDTDGNHYLDGMSGLWCVNVGFAAAKS
jgi:taurine-pyruvate aminotransferase